MHKIRYVKKSAPAACHLLRGNAHRSRHTGAQLSPMLVDPFQRAYYRRRSASLNSYRGTVKHATGLDATRVFNEVSQMTERFDSGFVGQACPGATGVLIHGGCINSLCRVPQISVALADL